MNMLLKTTVVAVGALVGAQAMAQVTFYERDGFQGRSFTTQRQIADFDRFGFNDRASSVAVAGNRWEVCDDVRFRGRCVVLRPGRYDSLAAMGLNDRVSSVRAINSNARVDESRYAPLPGTAQITVFEREDFRGRSFTTKQPVLNVARNGFNGRAASMLVVGAPWEVCDDVRFDGRCVVLRPGRYPSLAQVGVGDRIASARTVVSNVRVEQAPPRPAVGNGYNYRRRDNENLYQASVTSVRAVVGTPEQRCWVEREQVSQSQANVPAALAGALIGGILGHQVGGGRGKDFATVGGAVAGGVVGAGIGRDASGQPAATQSVQRCAAVPNQQQRPDYWDVTYVFRGQEYRIQTTTPPGDTVTVNGQGEPRV